MTDGPSRRTMLALLAATGSAGVVAGAHTRAAFVDDVGFPRNRASSGTLDLELAWNEPTRVAEPASAGDAPPVPTGGFRDVGGGRIDVRLSEGAVRSATFAVRACDRPAAVRVRPVPNDRGEAEGDRDQILDDLRIGVIRLDCGSGAESATLLEPTVASGVPDEGVSLGCAYCTRPICVGVSWELLANNVEIGRYSFSLEFVGEEC